MTEEQIKQASAQYEEKLRVWSKSQIGQTDAYEYESSFVAFSGQAAQESFQLAMGSIPESKNKKKCKNECREDHGRTRSCVTHW